MLPLSNSAQELSPVFVSSAYKTLVQQEMPVCSRYSHSLTKESYMENPRKRTTVATAAGGDGLHLFDHQQQQIDRGLQILQTGRRTKGAACFTHWALKSTTCQSNVNSAASETLFPPARLKGILKSSDAIRRGSGEKIKLPSGKWERNLRGRYVFTHSDPILNASRRLIAATWGAQKARNQKTK
jgi:hypothetical protein